MERNQKVTETVRKLAPELKELARFIHDNPELGMKEYKACEAQTNLLKKYGFDVTVGVCGFETA